MTTAYATAGDLTTWLGQSPPVDNGRLLLRAALEVDYALRGAAYTVDVNDMPTDTKVISALRDATCAQVEWWMTTQDEIGQYDLDHTVTVTIAGISRTRSPGRRPRLAPRAFEILQLARLLPIKGVA